MHGLFLTRQNNGVIYIQVSSFSKNGLIEIYNEMGQLVLSKQIEKEISLINLKDFKNGLYFVRLFQDEKLIKQQKITKE